MKTYTTAMVCSLLCASVALGGDGRMEISQSMVPYTIHEPGSYILTESLSTGDENTTIVMIHADNVALDLNGFRIAGPGIAGSGSGIWAPPSTSRTSVRNGIVSGMGSYGVCLGRDGFVQDVRAARNGFDGISIRSGSVLSCSTSENGRHGIAVNGGLVEQCTASMNGGSGIHGAATGAVITHNWCLLNEGKGIVAIHGAVVKSNTCKHNELDGIAVEEGTLVAHNVCLRNGQSTNEISAQVHVTGQGNQIVGNTLISSNEYGIVFVEDDGNFYARNVFRENAADVIGGSGNATGTYGFVNVVLD